MKPISAIEQLKAIEAEIPADVLARLLPCPPKRWKRPAMPNAVKLQVIINQEGKCHASGLRLGDIRHVNFDHRPALKARRYDPLENDTFPKANDARFIEAILIEEHRKRTKKDEKADAKAERLEKARLANPPLTPEDAELQIKISKQFAASKKMGGVLPEPIAEPQLQRAIDAYMLLPKREKKKSKYRWGSRPLKSRNTFGGNKNGKSKKKI